MGTQTSEDRELTGALLGAVTVALDRVIDPCSLGRGVPAGLVSMGMVKRVDVDEAKRSVCVTLQLTSPACHFQRWFFERVRSEVLSIPGVEECSVSFSKDFDWSDDSMSPAIREHLSERRRRLQLRSLRPLTSSLGAGVPDRVVSVPPGEHQAVTSAPASDLAKTPASIQR